MRISSLSVAIAMFLGCMFWLAQDFALADTPAVPNEPVAIQGSKKTVMFPHKPHDKIECVTCHHKVNDKETFQKCSDAGCHDNLTDKKGVQSLYFVMHSKSEDLKHQSCLQCHAKIAEEKPDLKKRLTGCTDSACHPKAASAS